MFIHKYDVVVTFQQFIAGGQPLLHGGAAVI